MKSPSHIVPAGEVQERRRSHKGGLGIPTVGPFASRSAAKTGCMSKASCLLGNLRSGVVLGSNSLAIHTLYSPDTVHLFWIKHYQTAP